MSHHIFDMIRRGQTAELAADLETDPSSAAARDAQGVSALIWSIYTHQTEIRDRILAHLSELDIFEAAAIGDTQCREALALADPATINTLSGDGWTPLHLAAAFAEPETVKLLLERAADVHAWSQNPLKNQPLHACIALGQSLESVKLLIDAGADVNTAQTAGYTPLHQAAAGGKKEVVLLLLERGANPNATSDEGKKAADYARERNHAEIATQLDLAANKK
jgi:ankyrin repeat protein